MPHSNGNVNVNVKQYHVDNTIPKIETFIYVLLLTRKIDVYFKTVLITLSDLAQSLHLE